MAHRTNNKPTPNQQRNMHFAEDRFQLLDTINDMINTELNRRGVVKGNNLQFEQKEDPPGEEKISSCKHLWNCIKKWWMSIRGL